MNSNQPEALGLTPAKRPVLVLNPTEDGSFTYLNNDVTICWRESFNISFHSDSFWETSHFPLTFCILQQEKEN